MRCTWPSKGQFYQLAATVKMQRKVYVWEKEMMFLGWVVWEHSPGQSDHSHLKGLQSCLQRWPVNNPNTGCTSVLLGARGYTVGPTNSRVRITFFFLSPTIWPNLELCKFRQTQHCLRAWNDPSLSWVLGLALASFTCFSFILTMKLTSAFFWGHWHSEKERQPARRAEVRSCPQTQDSKLNALSKMGQL